MQTTLRLRAGAPPDGGLSRPARVDAAALAPYALWLLLGAGVTELLLFRTLSRVGVHVPKHGAVLGVYDALVQVGSFAFNVSTLTAYLAAGLLAYSAYRSATGRQPLAAAGALLVLTLAGVSLLLSFAGGGPATRFAFGSAAVVAMLLLAGQAWRGRSPSGEGPLRAAIVTLAVLAYAAAQYHTLANHAYGALGIVSAPPGTRTALEAGELLVLLNAGAVFWAWSGVRAGRRWRPGALQVIMPALLVLTFLGGYFGRQDSSTTAILSLWTLGLTLYLPLPLYTLALGLYACAWAGCLSRARRDPATMGDVIALGLLPVAGLTLDTTYQVLVALVALLLLAAPHAADAREVNAAYLIHHPQGRLRVHQLRADAGAPARR
ncbi:MAG: hypothetical protein Q7T33_09950 [Dehalococcoidia bacterium]|nr:hypothetical protein [Dehalococcoidia bacterium]